MVFKNSRSAGVFEHHPQPKFLANRELKARMCLIFGRIRGGDPPTKPCLKKLEPGPNGFDTG